MWCSDGFGIPHLYAVSCCMYWSAWLTFATNCAVMVGGSKFSEFWGGENSSSGFLAVTTKAEVNGEEINRFLNQMGWESGACSPPAALLSPVCKLCTSACAACTGNSWSHWRVGESCLLTLAFQIYKPCETRETTSPQNVNMKIWPGFPGFSIPYFAWDGVQHTVGLWLHLTKSFHEEHVRSLHCTWALRTAP